MGRVDWRGPSTHQQVDSQLDFLKTVDELGLRGGPCTQRKDTLWNGQGGGYEPGWPSLRRGGPRLQQPPCSDWISRTSVATRLLHLVLSIFSCSPTSPCCPPCPTDHRPLRTCWPLLPFLLPLLALVQLFESFCRLLQPSHEPLNVVQGTVEDLLGSEQRQGFSLRRPHPRQGQPHTLSFGPWPGGRRRVLAGGWLEGPTPDGDAGRWGRPTCPKTHRFLFYLLSQHSAWLLILRLPTAEAWMGEADVGCY